MNNVFVNTGTADTAKEDCMNNVFVNTDTAINSKASKESSTGPVLPERRCPC